MAGGVWYGTMSSNRVGDPEPSDDTRIRAYDTSGTLIWDSAKDHRKGASDCARTPDGRVVGYVAPDVNGRQDSSTCRSAVPWTAGEPTRS